MGGTNYEREWSDVRVNADRVPARAWGSWAARWANDAGRSKPRLRIELGLGWPGGFLSLEPGDVAPPGGEWERVPWTSSTGSRVVEKRRAKKDIGTDL
jgi:hypothetical protein